MNCGRLWPRRGFLELLGGLAAVGVMQPENPLVGGTVLRRAAIESPNFVVGVSGWIIRQDGSAEFNNVVIRNGQVVSGTALYYSGAPAAGNLIASVAAAAGTDVFGNAYLAGITAYAPSGTAIQMQGGQLAFYTAPSEAGPWTNQGTFQANGPGAGLQISGLGHGLNIGNPATADAVSVPGNLTVTGLLTALLGLTVSGGPIQVSENSATGKVLVVTNTAGNPTGPNVQIVAALNGPDFCLGIQVSGDTFQRFRIDSDGSVHWGPGNLATDTALSRTAANVLRASGELDVAGILKALAGLSVVGGETADTIAVSSGQAGGNVLQVTNTTAAPSGASVHLFAAAAADRVLAIQVTGDTVTRWLIDSNGKQNWGPGGAAQDTDLYRNGVGLLQTDGTFVATVLRAIAAAAGNQALDVHVTGDTNPRLQSLGSGLVQWGPGNAGVDTALYRSAAALLAADPVAFNNAGVAETMQAFAFANSWAQTAGRVVCGYRRLVIPNEMEVMGSVTVPAGFAAGQNMTTAAPAAYQPVHTASLIAIDTTTNLVVRLAWGTNGILQFIGPTANTLAAHTLDIPVQRIHLTQ